MTRKEITESIQEKNEAIENLRGEIDSLQKQWFLLSDEKQWFTEEMETVTVKENGKKVKKEWLIGKIHWNEDFKDQSTGEKITIKRCQVVRVNGKWEW